MPRIVRNSWWQLEVDGKATNVETGPRAAGGGSFCRILLRENGTISNTALIIRQGVTTDPETGKDINFITAEVEGPGGDDQPMIHVKLPR